VGDRPGLGVGIAKDLAHPSFKHRTGFRGDERRIEGADEVANPVDFGHIPGGTALDGVADPVFEDGELVCPGRLLEVVSRSRGDGVAASWVESMGESRESRGRPALN
jgi:hypothetical protein